MTSPTNQTETVVGEIEPDHDGRMLAIAIGLLLMELFVPSGGLIGVLAGICAIGSLVAFFRYNTTLGFAMTTAYFVLTPIVIWAMFKFWISSPITRRLILGADEEDMTGEGGPGMNRAEMERRERLAQLQQLIGAEGVTVTPLRPVGVVRIQGERIDALAETGVIEANIEVTVTDVYDNQVKVRPKRSGLR